MFGARTYDHHGRKNSMNRIVYYHKDCSDGFGAALVAWKKFGSDDTVYLPWKYGDALPLDTTVDEIYLLDVVPRKEALKKLADAAGQVFIIDHHKTGIQELERALFMVPKLKAYCSREHSAAVLAWQYFFSTGNPPELILYIQDRDLWTNKLPHTNEIAAALRIGERSFEVWDRYLHNGVQELIDTGGVVLQTERHYYRRMLPEVQYYWFGGMKIPIINTDVDGSSAANELLQREHAHVAGYYFDRGDGRRQFGLRSDGSIDVSDIAKEYGGGGHPRAAGFTLLQEEAIHCVAVPIRLEVEAGR